jgi:hypothetical protein
MYKKIIIIFFCCIHLQSYAGARCKDTEFNLDSFTKAGNQAIIIEKTLIKENPQVALIARVGSNLSKYHLHYSHVAFLVRDTSGRHWNVMHLLNHCGRATSSIYHQGLMNFFLDSVYNYEAQLIIPSQVLQKKILVLLDSQQKIILHNRNYSSIAYPYSDQYQNSNQWVLEVVASALSGYNNRRKVQSWLQSVNFHPNHVSIPNTMRLGAEIFKINTHFDDHPKHERNTNTYSFVGVESIFNFLRLRHEIIFDKEFSSI